MEDSFDFNDHISNGENKMDQDFQVGDEVESLLYGVGKVA